MTTPALRQTDYGLFGPDSPTWKVWTSATALIGFQRSVVLEHFDPFLTAAVADSAGIYRDPWGRLDRTLQYFLKVAVADSRTVVAASEHLMRVHAPMTGVEPISGKRYSANNPESQLWIHVTGWHSVLKCYEMFGPGPLSADEESRYWAECVRAAEFQTCKPADVPTSREEVREYFARVRPGLCTSERALRAMHYLLWTPRRNIGIRGAVSSRAIAVATVATLPKWMRELGEFDQPFLLDKAVRPVARIAARDAISLNRVSRAVIAMALPETIAVLNAHRDVPEPAERRVLTPAEARARYGTQRATA